SGGARVLVAGAARFREKLASLLRVFADSGAVGVGPAEKTASMRISAAAGLLKELERPLLVGDDTDAVRVSLAETRASGERPAVACGLPILGLLLVLRLATAGCRKGDDGAGQRRPSRRRSAQPRVPVRGSAHGLTSSASPVARPVIELASIEKFRQRDCE